MEQIKLKKLLKNIVAAITPKHIQNLGICQGGSPDFLSSTSSSVHRHAASAGQKIWGKADAEKNQILNVFWCKGLKDVEITGITSHSKRVVPGNLFVAKKGLNADGTSFIPEAIANGAVAILTDLYDPFYPHIVQIIDSRISELEVLLAKEYYGDPGNHLFLVGITGTNGKTTTGYLVQHMLRELKEECGLIGTIEWVVGKDHVFPSEQTTPDVLTNHKLMHDMRVLGCQSCVYEVSSHALDQGRVNGIEFDIAVFTNLTQDHLDYHQSMEAYAAAKSKLFSSLHGSKPFPKTAVINVDCAYSKEMFASCPAQLLTYGIDQPADLYATEIALSASGLQFKIHYGKETYPFACALIGRFNVYNILAAVGVGLSKGYPLKKIVQALKSFCAVPGRLERVPNDKNLNIFVDYAHTEDALCNVLHTLREFTTGRLITVFGCGGNRDQTKRPKMGAVANSLSDLAVVTSDNPRNEDPEEIIRQILTGIDNKSHVLVIPDRKEAIYRTVDLSLPDDVILIAGKGHETQQIFSTQTIDFDDRAIAKSATNS